MTKTNTILFFYSIYPQSLPFTKQKLSFWNAKGHELKRKS